MRAVIFYKRCIGCTGKLCSLSRGPHKDTTAHLRGLSEHNQMVVVCLFSRGSNIADDVFVRRTETEGRVRVRSHMTVLEE